MKKLEDYVVSIPDFPEPGIIFRDVTSILQDADGLALAIDSIREMVKDLEYDVVVGPESRGFIFGVPVAYAEHKSTRALFRSARRASCQERPSLQSMIWSMAPLRSRFTRMPSNRARK